MNLDELRTVQAKERRKDSLQHLRDSFYQDVAAYVEDLKAERQRAADRADDPFSSPEVSRLTDEVETAEEVVEAVYERRVGKVVKLASFAAAEMPVDEDGMTAQERALFEDLVERIRGNKSTVLDILSGKHAPPEPSNVSPTDDPGEPDEPARPPTNDASAGGVLGDAMGGSSTGEDPSKRRPGTPTADAESPPDASSDSETGSTSDVSTGSPASTGGTSEEPTLTEADEEASVLERTTVRITRDVGEILGVDEREYDLVSEDVVTLPTANAEPLLQRDAAERLD